MEIGNNLEATQEEWNEVYGNAQTAKPWDCEAWMKLGTGALSLYLDEQNDTSPNNIFNILKKKGKKPNPKLLDYGGGTGWFSNYYSQHGFDVTLADISKVAIDKNDDIKVRKRITSSPSDLPIDEKYDVILCWAVFHHIDESKWENYVKEFRRRLNPWGMLIIGGWDQSDHEFVETPERISNVTNCRTWNISAFVERQKKSEIVHKGDIIKWHEDAYNSDRSLTFVILAERKILELKSAIEKNPKVIAFQTVFYNHNSRDNYVLDDSESMFYFRDDTAKKQISELFQDGFSNLSEAKLGCSLHSAIYKCLEPKRSFYWQWQKDIQGKIELSFYEPNQIEESTGKDQTSSQTGATDFIENSTKEFFSNMERGKDNNNSQYKAGDEDTVVTLMNTWLDSDEGRKVHYYALFLPILNGSGSSEYIDASLDLFCKDKLTEEEYNAIYANFALWSAEKTSESLLKKIRKESIKSAIAAIMSRNMSHNLGSHFIAHTKNYFSQLISSIGDDDTKKNYRGVKHTLQYIQERMDFIATVMGRVTFPYGPVNVKSQLFDELTPDDFAERHKDQESYNFLLDYLVSSERISKRSSIKENEKENYKPFLLRIGYKDENGETRIWNSQAIDSSDSEQDKNKLLNIDLAIPGGVLGRHAIFTIVENIIRNVAKHDAANIGKELCVTIIVGEDNIVIYDNIKRDEKDETVKTLNEKLEELEILNVNGELNNENKGLKEMLISAIWLQNKVVSEKLWLCERNIDEINKYIEIKYVDENGNPKVAGDNEGTRHLGYVVKNICRFEKTHLIPTQDAPIPYNVIKDIKAEVICSECDYETDNGKKLSELFPHFVKISENEFPSLYDVTHKLKERFDENDNYKLFVAALGFNPDDFCVMIKPSDSDSVGAFNKKLKGTGKVKYVKDIPTEGISNTILFVNHLDKNPENAIKYEQNGIRPRRLDSISGGNFTHTITQPEFLMDRFNRLRVIESELVNIIIIDERAYLKYFDPSSIQDSEKLKEKYKGLATRIFNEREKIKDNSTCFDTCVNIMDDFDAFALFDSSSNKIKELVYGDDISVDTIVNNIISIQQSDSGTSWKTALQKRGIEIYNIVPDGAVEPNKKYVLKDLLDNTIISYVKKDENAGYVVHPCSCSIEEDRPKTFLSIHLGLIEKVNEVTHVSAAEIMNSLRNAFMPDYVAIHSGRGTSNDMIEGELKEYAFINFSSIQGPLDDSKYFLARQFCNFRYGKENR